MAALQHHDPIPQLTVTDSGNINGTFVFESKDNLSPPPDSQLAHLLCATDRKFRNLLIQIRNISLNPGKMCVKILLSDRKSSSVLSESPFSQALKCLKVADLLVTSRLSHPSV